MAGEHQSNKDKLLYTLGKVKGSTTGGLGYLIKHIVIENKANELKEKLDILTKQKET